MIDPDGVQQFVGHRARVELAGVQMVDPVALAHGGGEKTERSIRRFDIN